MQQGVLFALGAVVLAIAAISFGWLLYERMQLDTSEVVIEQAHLEAWDQRMMSMDAAASIDLWNYLSRPLPEDRRLPKFEMHRAEARVIHIKMGIAGGAAAIALGLMLAAIVFKPRVARPAKRRKQPATA